MADGVWVPGIGVPGVLGNMQNSTLGQNLCWDPQMHKKKRVQLVMSIGNIYIYVYIHSYGMIKCRT